MAAAASNNNEAIPSSKVPTEESKKTHILHIQLDFLPKFSELQRQTFRSDFISCLHDVLHKIDQNDMTSSVIQMYGDSAGANEQKDEAYIKWSLLTCSIADQRKDHADCLCFLTSTNLQPQYISYLTANILLDLAQQLSKKHQMVPGDRTLLRSNPGIKDFAVQVLFCYEKR